MARIWGRVGTQWVKVETSPTGDNSAVSMTWLIQVLKLNTGESPFYASWGLPAQSSVMSQVQPDMAVTLTQQRFAPLFASLVVSKAPQQANQPKPVYNISAVTLSGAVLLSPIPE